MAKQKTIVELDGVEMTEKQLNVVRSNRCLGRFKWEPESRAMLVRWIVEGRWTV